MGVFLRKYYLFLIPILAFGIIRFCFNFDGFYGQDSYEYLRYSKALNSFMKTGENPGDYFWPVLYPLFGAILNFVLEAKWALQLISFVCFLGTIIVIKRVLKLVYSIEYTETKSNLFLLLALVLSPYFFRASFLGMTDMAGAFLLSLSFYYLIKFKTEFTIKYGLLFGLTAGTAVMTRYQTGIVIFPFVCYFLFVAIQKRKYLILFAVGLVALLPVVPHFIVRGSNSLDFIAHKGIVTWDFSNFISREFATEEGKYSHLYPNILYVFSPFFHPGYLASGIVLLFFSKFKKRSFLMVSALLGIGMYLLVMAGIRIQNMRFFIVVFPLCVILFYPAFSRLMNKSNKLIFNLGFVLVLLAQIAYFSLSFSKFSLSNSLEREVAASIIEMKTDAPIYGFVVDISLPHRSVGNEIRNLWEQEFIEFETNALVIFNEDLLKDQWAGKNPMINWNRLKNDYQLVLIKECQSGWKIYRIDG